LLTSLGPYVTLSLGMLVTTIVVRGHLDALVRNDVLVLADAFSLAFFVAATLAMLFLALSSAAMVAREREQGTLETLFYGPVDPAAYVLAKHLAQLAVYLPMALLIGLLFVAEAVMTGLHLNSSFALELLLSVATAAAVVALGLLLSTLTRGVRTAFALFAVLTAVLLAVRFGSELLSGVRVANNYSPLLFARDMTIGLDRLLSLVSPFTALENGVDAVVRGDPLAYVGALALSVAQSAVLLVASVWALRRGGVRR
jgi:ABC-type transport system involved in multi-copper enzyme maturation permease subunit